LARADYDAHLADLHARAKAHTAKLEALRDHLAASRNAPHRKDLHAQLKTERESRARCLQEIRTLLHLQLRQQSHTSSTLIQSQAA